MAKKQKRRASTTITSNSSEQPISKSKTISRSFSGEFDPDYRYIIQDLKRIAILAGSFFIILIALSFILK